MKMHSIRSLFAILLGTTLLFASAAPVHADGDDGVDSTVPISDTIFNVCTNEVVDFTGTRRTGRASDGAGHFRMPRQHLMAERGFAAARRR